ncbi:MAG: hypothetical protein IVW53_15635 [Chloroflexi bacterium]|nr:hypothetical protein [Chloroflexota bacterium]
MPKLTARGQIRWSLVLGIALAVPIAIFAAAIWWAEYGALSAHRSIGLDYRVFVSYGQRLLDTRSLYLPAQLTGHYEWASLPADPLLAPSIPSALPCVYPPLVALLVRGDPCSGGSGAPRRPTSGSRSGSPRAEPTPVPVGARRSRLRRRRSLSVARLPAYSK